MRPEGCWHITPRHAVIQPEITSLENRTRSRRNCTPVLLSQHLFFEGAPPGSDRKAALESDCVYLGADPDTQRMLKSKGLLLHEVHEGAGLLVINPQAALLWGHVSK